MQTKTHTAQHTPGPWKVYGRDGKPKCYVTDSEGRTIADLDSFCTGSDSREQLEANARLIAHAPALLEALKAIAGMKVNGESDHRQLLALCMGIASTAIAQATNQEEESRGGA